MAERDGDTRRHPEDGDPLLVRPYLGGEPGAPAPDVSAETWPDAAPVPAAFEPGAPVPAAAALEPAAAPRRRRAALIVGGVVALVTGLGVAGAIAALPSGSDRGPQAFTDVSLPPYATPTTAGTPPATAVPQGAVLTESRRKTSSPTASGPSAPAASSASAATSPPVGRAPDMRISSPTPTLSPLPSADRIGAIGGLGDLCLDLNGGVPSDGNHIQVYECNRTPAQIWTLATDGTLRVVGMWCAAPVEDGTMHIAVCDRRPAAQWRAGPDRSLVAVASGGCLTDPSNGTRSGEWVRLASCTGAGNQRWRLP